MMTGRARVRARATMPAAELPAGALPSLTSAPLTSPDAAIAPREQLAASVGRFRRLRKIAGAAASVVLVAAIFGVALPHVASYRSAWASVQVMTWQHVLLVVIAAGASLVAGWLAICSVLPSIRLRDAALVNLGSSAV